MPEPLAAVRLVCQAHERVAALAHVAHTVDAFMWTHASWTLESASEHGLMSLLDRLLKLEWPGFNRPCREQRLGQAIAASAVGLYDAQVTKWWYSYIPGCKVSSVSHMYEMAIEYDCIPILEWIYQENDGVLPRLQRPLDGTLLRLLGHLDFDHSPNTAAWLLEHGCQLSCDAIQMNKNSDTTSFQSVQRCLKFQSENSAVEILKPEYSVHTALLGGRLDDLLWVHEHRPEFFGPDLLRAAVRYGNLDAAKWLVHTFPVHYFNNPKRTFAYRFDLGAYRYSLAMVQWVLCEFEWRKQRNRNEWMREARDYAARAGKLEMLQFVYAIYTERLKSAQAIALALRKWTGPRLMDEAAGNGHLDVVEFLHSRHPDQQCSSNAMDVAAGNGHLDVVQWLHKHRPEGCTKEAMNSAAANGHLQVVQFLHDNRTEGCTKKAMNAAARNGFLHVVRFLHENRREGCSRKAMDRAAENAHLHVVQFLHANRREGRPADALLRADARAQYDVYEWLRDNRYEHVRPDNAGPGLSTCEALYAKCDCPDSFIDKTILSHDFDMIERLISNARRKNNEKSMESHRHDLAMFTARIKDRVDCVTLDERFNW